MFGIRLLGNPNINLASLMGLVLVCVFFCIVISVDLFVFHKLHRNIIHGGGNNHCGAYATGYLAVLEFIQPSADAVGSLSRQYQSGVKYKT